MSNPPPLREDIRRITRKTHPRIRELLMRAHQQGFKVSRGPNNHFKVEVPDEAEKPLGLTAVFLPTSPSGIRSADNCRSKLRRIGVDFSEK